MKINDQKTINAWCMYDWANSVYSLVITTAIFPIFYNTFTVKNEEGYVDFFGFEMIDSVLYSYALSVSFLIVAAIIPLLSGLADYTGRKKVFMKVFIYIGSLSCMALYFYEGDYVEYAIIFSVLASIGFSGSLVFYDAFLPEIASEDQQDRVSAKGYSYGYAGSVLLLVFNLFMIGNYSFFGLENEKQAMQISFFMVGIWWILFSQIPLYRLQDSNIKKIVKGTMFLKGYREVKSVLFELVRLKEIKIFITSYFFYNTGVQTIILLASTFAVKVIGMEGASLILLILIIQLVALVGAFVFSRVSSKIGNKKTLQIMIVVWIGICVSAYFVSTQSMFYLVAGFVGLVMGGIQSLSRATFSKLIPENTTDHASYFGFYNIVYYISIVFGTFFYGFVEQMTENMRLNAILLAFWFVIGFLIISKMKPLSIRNKSVK